MPSLSNPVKAVFFDLGWTLVYPPSGDWEFTEPAKKLFRWDVYATLPEERRAQGRHTYQLFEDSIPTLEALRGKYKLGVISDTWPSIVPVLEEFGLPGYFDTLTYSFEVGCFKPDPRMFADALGKMGLPPEQCVFIDDTAQNLVGAQKLGIQPVQIRKKPGADPCPQGMLSIDKISGILELLP